MREYNPQPLRRAPKPFIVPKSSSLTNQASQPCSKLKTLQSQQSLAIVDQKTFQDSGKGIDTNSPPFPRKLPKWPPIKDDISEDTWKYRSVPSNSSTTSNILKTHFNERNSSVIKETLKMMTTNSIYDTTPCRPAPRPPLWNIVLRNKIKNTSDAIRFYFLKKTLFYHHCLDNYCFLLIGQRI